MVTNDEAPSLTEVDFDNIAKAVAAVDGWTVRAIADYLKVDRSAVNALIDELDLQPARVVPLEVDGRHLRIFQATDVMAIARRRREHLKAADRRRQRRQAAENAAARAKRRTVLYARYLTSPELERLGNLSVAGRAPESDPRLAVAKELAEACLKLDRLDHPDLFDLTTGDPLDIDTFGAGDRTHLFRREVEE